MEKERVSGGDIYEINSVFSCFTGLNAENEINGKSNFSKTSYKKIDISGIRLLYGKLSFSRPVPLQIENSEPYIEMFFSLAGSREMRFTQSDTGCSVKAGRHTILYIPDTEFYIEPFDIPDENISFQVQFSRDYFTRFVPEGSSVASGFINSLNKGIFSMPGLKPRRISPEMYSIINDIVHCEKEGVIKQLFLETNILKLLLLQFEQFDSAAEKKEYKSVKKYDIEKLEMVKSLLEEDLSYAHSLAELSRKSGLNDFKLKKGFKELFGTTVFGYLHELRMERAKTLLFDDTKTIAEIAGQCGYSYVQSFTTAFKNKFGTTPEKFRK